jgi:hypothetical protein
LQRSCQQHRCYDSVPFNDGARKQK